MKEIVNNQNQIAIYQTPEGNTNIEVALDGDTIWLSQAQMAELFATSRVNITEHIGFVYKDKELIKGATSRKFRLVRNEGSRMVSRQVEQYNLDVIISVG